MTNEDGMGGISSSNTCLGESQRGALLWRQRRLKTERFSCLQGADPELRHHQGLDPSRGVGGDTTSAFHTLSASLVLRIAKYCLEGMPIAPRSALSHPRRQQGWGWDGRRLAKTWAAVSVRQSIPPATQLHPNYFCRVSAEHDTTKPWTPSAASPSRYKVHHGFPYFL